MVAVAPTLDARSQRSRSVRAMVLPRPDPENIDRLVTTTGLIAESVCTTLRPVTDFAQRTIDLARQNVAEGGRPFATVIVQDGEILAESANKVAQTNDPTAHAEILAIREACMKLGTEHLVDSTIYVMAHPCPMCLGSLYYCSPREVIFGGHARVLRAVLPRRPQILRGLDRLRRVRQGV